MNDLQITDRNSQFTRIDQLLDALFLEPPAEAYLKANTQLFKKLADAKD